MYDPPSNEFLRSSGDRAICTMAPVVLRGAAMGLVCRLLRSGLAPAALASGLAACSMHPLPEDVTRRTTFDIVEAIRCEAKAGLAGFSVNDEIIKGSTIGMTFEFEITENNNANNGALGFFKPGKPSLDLDLTGSATRQRYNRRTFKIVDNLKDLFGTDCRGVASGVNRTYPIAGKIGADEVVRTYLRLRQLTEVEEQSGNLFSDSLKFTTTISAGATPMLTLSTGGGGLRFTNASVSLNADRTDNHNVDIALAYDKSKPPGGPPGGKSASIGKNKVAAAGKEVAFYPPPRSRGEGLGKRVQDPADGQAGQSNDGSAQGFNPLECERWQVLEKDVLRDSRTIEAFVRRCLDARNRVLMELDRLRDLREDETSAATRLGQRLLEIMRLP